MKKYILSLAIVALVTLALPRVAAAETPLASTAIYSLDLMQTTANVKNPSGVTWTASADHAALDGYDLSLRKADGTLLQVINLGKPTPDATNTCTAPLNVQPVAFGVNYYASLVARAGSAVSDPAVSVNAFDRVPGGPSKVTIK